MESARQFTVQGFVQMEKCRLPAASEGALGYAKQFGGLGLGQPLIPKQFKRLALLVGQRFHLLMQLGPGRQSTRLVGALLLLVSLGAPVAGALPERAGVLVPG